MLCFHVVLSMVLSCSTSCKFPGDDCPPMWGACKHAFHMHCILQWLKAQTDKEQAEQCPLCRAPWEMAQ